MKMSVLKTHSKNACANLKDDVIYGDDVGVRRQEKRVLELPQEVVDGHALLVDRLQDDLFTGLAVLRQVNPGKPALENYQEHCKL